MPSGFTPFSGYHHYHKEDIPIHRPRPVGSLQEPPVYAPRQALFRSFRFTNSLLELVVSGGGSEAICPSTRESPVGFSMCCSTGTFTLTTRSEDLGFGVYFASTQLLTDQARRIHFPTLEQHSGYSPVWSAHSKYNRHVDCGPTRAQSFALLARGTVTIHPPVTRWDEGGGICRSICTSYLPCSINEDTSGG